MPASSANLVLHHLRRTVLLENGGGLSDGQLLEAFIVRQDEAAFEALVRRHGPMVLGVCRRVIGHEPDAEDAFQAAFLVLVRRAASIVPREKLGNWLYGVAYRTALEARKTMLRRRIKEKPLTDLLDPNTPSKAERQELTELLDQELSRLPDKYRLPVVLCELEGRSRKEVAQQLRLPEGTLSSRLATARKMLARRLTRRGFVLSAGALALELSRQGATAGIPAALVNVTVQTASTMAQGVAPISGFVSAKVISLSEGVCKAMFLAKLKLTAVAVLTILTAGLGAGLLTHQGLADQPAQPKSQEAAKPVAKPDNPPSDKDKLQGTWMLIARDEDGKRRDFPQGVGILLIVDGNKLTTREDPVGLFAHGSGSVSESSYALRPKDDPKGIDLLYLNGPKKDQPWKHGIYSLEGNQLKICWGDEENQPAKFDTTDSKWVLNVFQRIAVGKPVAERAREKWKVRLDFDTKHSQQVSYVAFSPDGKLLATGSLDKTVKLWDASSGKEIGMLRMSGPLPVTYVEFSPDGKLLAAVETDVDERRAGRVSVWDVKTLKFKFYTPSQGGQINSMAFSPDGRLLAVAGLDKIVWLFDASRAGKLLRQLTGHKTNINSLKFSPDGKILASAGSDSTVRLWDPASGKEIRRLQVHGGTEGAAHRAGGVRAVRFTSDGKWIVTAGDDALNLWQAVTGKQILEYFGQNGGVLIVEASPDGKTLAVTERHADQTVVLLDIEPMKELAKLTGHQQPVNSVAFSPDGNTLATAGDGTHIKLWSREVPPSRNR